MLGMERNRIGHSREQTHLLPGGSTYGVSQFQLAIAVEQQQVMLIHISTPGPILKSFPSVLRVGKERGRRMPGVLQGVLEGNSGDRSGSLANASVGGARAPEGDRLRKILKKIGRLPFALES